MLPSTHTTTCDAEIAYGTMNGCRVSADENLRRHMYAEMDIHVLTYQKQYNSNNDPEAKFATINGSD